MAKRNQPLLSRQAPAVSAWQQLNQSVHLALKHYELILYLFFIPSLILVLAGYYLGSAFKISFTPHFSGREYIGLYLLAAWFIVSVINYPAAIFFRLRAVKSTKTVTLFECYRAGFKLFLRVWSSTILSILIIAIGFVALIVPGIMFFRRFILVPYYAADNPSLSLRNVFKVSNRQSAPFTLAIYGTYALVIGVNLIAELIFGGFGLGSIVIYLVSYLVLFMPALRYAEIKSFNPKSVLS